MKLFKKVCSVWLIFFVGWIMATALEANDSFWDMYPMAPTEDYYETHHICDKCVKIKNIDILSPDYKLIAIYHESYSNSAHMYEIEEDTCLKWKRPLSYSETTLYFVKNSIINQTFSSRQEIRDWENKNKKHIIKIWSLNTDWYYVSNKSQKKYENIIYEIIASWNISNLQETDIKIGGMIDSWNIYKIQRISTKTNLFTFNNIILLVVNIFLLCFVNYFLIKNQNKKKVLITSIALPTIIFGTIFLTIKFIPQQWIYRLLLWITSSILSFLLAKILLKTKRKYAIINWFICFISTLLLVRLIWW